MPTGDPKAEHGASRTKGTRKTINANPNISFIPFSFLYFFLLLPPTTKFCSVTARMHIQKSQGISGWTETAVFIYFYF